MLKAIVVAIVVWVVCRITVEIWLWLRENPYYDEVSVLIKSIEPCKDPVTGATHKGQCWVDTNLPYERFIAEQTIAEKLADTSKLWRCEVHGWPLFGRRRRIIRVIVGMPIKRNQE